nr:hypothetical protein [Tanacetum cinerariifolium]
MYPRFLQLMIRKQVGDLSTHTTKHTSPALTQKVFANMKRVGDTDENNENVNAGDAAEGDVSAATAEDPTVVEEPFIPSPTPPTPPPQPSQYTPSTSQVQPTPPQSPQVQPPSPQPQPQPQPQHDAEIPMNLLQEVMDTCTALTRRVEHLEFDKVAQAIRITKVETSDETVMDDESNQERMIVEMDQDVNVVLKDVKEDDKEVADAVKDVQEILSMQEDETEPAKVQEIVEVVANTKLITEVVTAASTTIIAVAAQVPAVRLTATPVRVSAAPRIRTKGVVIRDTKEYSPSTIIPIETKSKDKGKRILVEEPKPLKKQAQIEQDEQFARELEAKLNRNIDWDEAIDHVKKKAKEDPVVKKYQVLKRKPQTEGQARKNMIVYLKNVVGFRMDYFKGMSYDDIHHIFEAKFNSNVAFLQKTREDIEEEESRALKRINETPAERVAKRQKIDEDVEELKRHLQIIIEMNNKPYYKIIRADDTYQLYVSFPSLLRNFDREELEALWSLVKERFFTSKPKNFFDDFLFVTLGAMFENPDIHAQIWKNQRSVHGLTKVKGWKLLESCGVQIITFITTQLILLVERKYPLTRFTLDQMLNAVRLEVEKESEVSLELLRFIR